MNDLNNYISCPPAQRHPHLSASLHTSDGPSVALELLHRVFSHLEKPGSPVRILFFNFFSAFKTIQPRILKEKLQMLDVDLSLGDWILDSLTDRPQFVRARDCV